MIIWWYIFFWKGDFKVLPSWVKKYLFVFFSDSLAFWLVIFSKNINAIAFHFEKKDFFCIIYIFIISASFIGKKNCFL
jgi:hypothetical protein